MCSHLVDVHVAAGPDGVKCLRGHRGAVSYEGVPATLSPAATHYFVALPDLRKQGRLTCSHAPLMEMRICSAEVDGTSSAHVSSGSMSYGESRVELIDSFGSRKVNSTVFHQTLLTQMFFAGEDRAPENEVVARGGGRPRGAQQHHRLPQRRGSCESQAPRARVPI